MVDFNNISYGDGEYLPLDPIEIFDQLPKSNRISNLYHSQAEIVTDWYSEKRNKRDVIIELNTGGGKTLIGLLIAMSIMHETEMGVLYLVENRQLLDQVVSQGQELGMPIRAYNSRESLDAKFDNGELILVGTYKALFNGKSSFGIWGQGQYQKVGGIIVDDAHASLDAVRSVFSLNIPADTETELYKRIIGLFRKTFESLELETTYQEFFGGIGGLANDRVVEIPFWEWSKSQQNVSSVISIEYAKRVNESDEFSNNLKFSWPLLRDNLKYCQVTVSRRAIAITSLYPLVSLFPTFTEARRRIFMSATITDYGDMVRAYDLREITSDSIIAPNTPAGIGRRMILPLRNEYANSQSFSLLIESEISKGHGVVRLVPKRGIEETWYGKEPIEEIGHALVSPIVDKLRAGQCQRIVSFVNRYNGIDLPDDSCRVLILHGLPTGSDDSEKLLSAYLSDSSVNAQRVAQRIEQGIGRGVRSGSDHCVVLLEDEQLIDWVSRKNNYRHFSVALKAQLDMGNQIMLNIGNADEYCDVIRQDLSSESSWTSYHSRALSQAVKNNAGSDGHFGLSFEAALAERRAFACWREHRSGEGAAKLKKAVTNLDDDKQFCGWLLQLAARITFDGDVSNSVAADRIQREAHHANRNIPYFSFTVMTQNPDWAIAQAKALLDALSKDGRNDPLGVFDAKISNLIHKAPSNDFEQSLVALGIYLGFGAEKHDRRGEGSDVIWISPDGIGFVLEAKNDKDADTPFHKKDAGQLRTAHDWLHELHPDFSIVPVSVHPSCYADKNASASNLYVLVLSDLDALKEEVRRLVDKANTCLPNNDIDELAHYLDEHELSAQGICDSYLKRFTPLPGMN